MEDHAGTSPDLERLRAFVAGELPEAEAEAFRAQLDGDAELAALTEAYAVVVEATDGEAPASRTTFADLKLDQEPRRPRILYGRLAAAAALLIAVGVAIWLQRDGQRVEIVPDTVTLASIALDASAPAQPPPIPKLLARYRTFGEAGLNWIRDLEQGRDLARFLGRPVVLFVDHPTCPICAAYEKGPFTDPDVGSAADSFVLLRGSWNTVPPEFVSNPNEGWPLFHLCDDDLERLTGFKGWRETDGLIKEFERFKKRADREQTFAYRDAYKLRQLAQRLAGARAESDPGARYDGFAEVAAKDAETSVGGHARYELALMESAARDALARARIAEPDEALAVLDSASAELAGTPYAADLDRVAASIRRNRRFPELESNR